MDTLVYIYTYRLVHRPYLHDWLVKKKPAVSRPAKEISQGLADEGVLWHPSLGRFVSFRDSGRVLTGGIFQKKKRHHEKKHVAIWISLEWLIATTHLSKFAGTQKWKTVLEVHFKKNRTCSCFGHLFRKKWWFTIYTAHLKKICPKNANGSWKSVFCQVQGMIFPKQSTRVDK